jgi:hypothetical protein
MDMFDTAAAFAWMKQGLSIAPFPSAYPARIYICYSILPLGGIGRILRIVHDVWWGFVGYRL